jgi:transcription elongation factor GreA
VTETAKGAYLTQARPAQGEQAPLDRGRVELSRRSAARLEGIRENGGYAAKEEQGKMEARIRQRPSAGVGHRRQTRPGRRHRRAGMVVTVEMFDGRDLLSVCEIQDHTDLHVFSEASPLGRAVNGRTVGETVSYVAPNGKSIEVKILNTSPYAG